MRPASQRTQGTVVTGIFAGRTGPVELHATDAAHLVLRHVPSPCRHGIPLFDRDFHGEFERRGLQQTRGVLPCHGV